MQAIRRFLDWLRTPSEVQYEAVKGELAHYRAEFAQMQLEWAEMLDKLTAWTQRQATRDRRAMQKLLESSVPNEQPPEGGDGQLESREAAKAALRARAAQLRRK